jgi:hypothetical protein
MSVRDRAAELTRCAVVGILATGATMVGGCSCTRKSDVKTMSSATPLEITDASLRCPVALVNARQGGTDPTRYVVPTADERRVLREAIARYLRDGDNARESVALALSKIGFEVIDVAEMHGAVLLREREGEKRGGGAYVLRPASTSRVFVEAPHTFFDEGTFPLACELFRRANAHALFIETAHRYKSAPPNVDGSYPADVAHAEDSLFQAATEGVLDAMTNAKVVQLHGFVPRESFGSVVLSSGDKVEGQRLVLHAKDRLDAVLGSAAVRRFPEDASELGATTNVQGVVVRKAGGEFLHVEIEARLRRDLLKNPQLRANVIDAIATALEDA